MMALKVVGVSLMEAVTLKAGVGMEADLWQAAKRTTNMTRRQRRMLLDLSGKKRRDRLKIGQVLQYFAVHFVGAEGFVQEAVEAVVLEVLVHILIYRGRKGDCGDVLIDAPDLFQQGFPIHQRHFEVDEQQVEGAAPEQFPGDFAVFGGLDGGAPAMEE